MTYTLYHTLNYNNCFCNVKCKANSYQIINTYKLCFVYYNSVYLVIANKYLLHVYMLIQVIHDLFFYFKESSIHHVIYVNETTKHLNIQKTFEKGGKKEQKIEDTIQRRYFLHFIYTLTFFQFIQINHDTTVFLVFFGGAFHLGMRLETTVVRRTSRRLIIDLKSSKTLEITLSKLNDEESRHLFSVVSLPIASA
ncbi:hypothetical protein AGLY_010966 [Aphis glycines]|uniref:Uncharacterized protein n=1 Tax=Aphis glycines TaxID=307491 RepID=A0A6G0TDF6_APHGL|nr:hypothetical protein AGLY_010966 [Aphis glycines]